MTEDNEIKGLAVCTKVVFNKGSFVIASFRPVGDSIKVPSFTMKGNMFVNEGQEYEIIGSLDTKNKYKNSYNAIMVSHNIDLSKASDKELVSFFATIISKKQAENLVKTLDDPIKVLEDGNIQEIIKVKGIGVARAERLVGLYASQKDYSPAIIAFDKYGITEKSVKKIVDFFNSVEKAVSIVSENPYAVVSVPGFGFKKADVMFLTDEDNDPADIRRVRAYVDYLFIEEIDNGNTWITPREFIAKFESYLPMADVRQGIDYINESDEFTVLNTPEDEKAPKKISSKKALQMEIAIAAHLDRLMGAPSTMTLEDSQNIISRVESAQGWEYTEEQKSAIDIMFRENVHMLQGLAGTGKSSAANGFLSVVEQNGYSYCQCALSGKAANNLAQITGKDGSTIHSLLGFEPTSKSGFAHDEINPLPYNVIVLDELSMVSAEIFLSLLQAIRTGSKLIMLGDYGQLESIGVGVMGGLIRSKVIPMTLLKKIHRQAAKSAIITHSIHFREGILPEELKLTPNTRRVYGENQDLEYVLVENDEEENIGTAAMRLFKENIEEYGVDGVQIITQTKTTGAASAYRLNKLAQLIANPKRDDFEPELQLGYGDNKYSLRAGDKVINLKNNKKTLSPSGAETPIFNGNTGIVLSVDTDDRSILIDFDGIGEVEVTGEAVDKIDLGYSITVHKSQGSTIPCVIFAMPFHFLLNSRELVYTGCTRAKGRQIFITSPKSLRAALKKTSSKIEKTNLAYLLKMTFNKESIDKVA